MAGTTLHTHDYLGREIANAVPGTTDPTQDYLGRENEGDDDYLGRTLTTPA